MKFLQRLKRNNKTNIARWISALMAAVLLAVSVPVPAFADASDDLEITFVTLPQGYGHLTFGGISDLTTYSGSSLAGSKSTLTLSTLKTYGKFILTTPLTGSSHEQEHFKLIDGSFIDLTKPGSDIDSYITYPTSNWKHVDMGGGGKYYRVEYVYSNSNTLATTYFNNNYTGKKYAVVALKMNPLQQHSSHNVYSGDKMTDTDSYTYNQNNELTGAVVTAAYPNAWGSTSGDTQAYVSTETTISANPKEGYRFDHWEKNGDFFSYNQSVSVMCDGTFDAYVAIFVEDDKADGVFTESMEGITLTPYGTTSGDTYRREGNQVNTQATLQAYPTDDAYVFDHWEFRRGTGTLQKTVSYSNPYTVKVEDQRDVYTAVFLPKDKANGVFTKSNNDDWGTTSGDTYHKINGQVIDQTTLQASPESDDYVFDHWELSRDGATGKKVSEANPYTVKVDDHRDVYTAVFKKNTYAIEAKVADAHGSASGSTRRYVNGQEVTQATIEAFPYNGYVFDHWVDDKGTVYYNNPYNIVIGKEDRVFTAYFTQTTQAHGVFTMPNVSIYGTTSGDTLKVVNGQPVEYTTIQAFPESDKYVFDHWEISVNGGERGSVSNANPYTVKVRDYNDLYIAVFKEVSKEDGVFTEPDDPDHGTTSGDTFRRANGQTINQTTIQATPKSNEYVFDHWNRIRDGGTILENVSTSNPYIVKVDDHRDVYIAVFNEVSKEHGVFTKPDNDKWGTTSGDTYRTANGQTINQTTIQATPKSNEYVFDHWDRIRDDGTRQENVSTANPYIVKVDDHKDEYIAVFKEVSKEDGVFTKPDDTEHGTTSGDTYRTANGQTISQTTIQATPESDDYKFDHWELNRDGVDQGTVSRSNPYIVKVGDHIDIYTAVFVDRVESDGVFTKSNNESWGTTSGDSYRKVNGQTVSQTTIQAFPESDDYVFDHWELVSDGVDKGRVTNANPYTVKVGDRVDTYTAVFVKKTDGDGVFTQPDDEAHGTTTGDSYRKVNGQTVTQTTIQAFPTSNEWVFHYWELISDGTSKGKIAVANPYTVKVRDSSDLYIAHFRKRGEGGSGELPSKKVKGKATGVTDDLIDVTKRDFSTPALIVDRNYVAALAQDTVGGQLGRYAFMTPYSGLASRLESLSSKLIPNEKKERLDNGGFELVTSDGEIIDIEKVSADAKMKTQAEDAVEDKYGALYKAEILTAGDVPYVSGFDDGNHTVFWSDTGAKKGDRLLIIQQLPDLTSKTVTPIVDSKGDVRFTTSDYIGSRFILLKVSYNN